MRIFHIYWRKSIFTRLLSVFFIILIPVYIFGFAFFQRGEEAIREGVTSAMAYQSGYFLENFDVEVKRMRLMASELINDNDLNILAASGAGVSEIDKTFAIQRLQARLTSIRNSGRYIQDVSVMIPRIAQTVSSYNGRRYIIDDINRTEYSNLKEALLTYNSRLFVFKGSLAFGAAHPFSALESDEEPLFIVLIELSPEELTSAVRQMDEGDGGVCILFDEKGKGVLAGDAPPALLSRVNSAPPGFGGSEIYRAGGVNYLMVSGASNDLGLALVKGVAEDLVFKPLYKYRIMFWIFTAMVVLIIASFSVYTYKLMQKPLLKLAESFRRLEENQLDVRIEHPKDDEFGYIYARFNGMVQNIRKLIQEVYQSAILRRSAELKQLQSQINPHFLYNSFLTLNTMIRMEEYEDLEPFTKLLGDYFQYITRSAADEAPLSREVEHARGYCEIQAARFTGRIRVEFESLPEDCADIAVPRLILQPVIENAFVYGLEDKASDGLLSVRFENDAVVLRIVVEDNGENLQPETLRALNGALEDNGAVVETTALINISRRLKLRLGADSDLTVGRGPMGGCRVVLVIPK